MKIKIFCMLAAQMALSAVFCTNIFPYSTPLSWLPMSMPIVSYNPATNKLAVETKPVAPLGTNTTAAGSGAAAGIASFDPVQVWGVLNTTAFSRTLGWYDQFEGMPPNDIMSKIASIYGFEADTVTPRGRVWIEATSQSPELSSYLAVGMYGVNADYSQAVDYANPSGIPYSGIFGTLGSSAKWQWDALMDHNAYSVPFSLLSGPNQPFFANYRLYIGDAAGSELLTDKDGTPVASAATTTTWNWRGPAFVFASQYGVQSGATVESDVYTAAGITAPGTSTISISNGEYAVSTDNGATWGAWTSAAGTIANNNRVKVRQTSAAGHGAMTLAALAIPGVVGSGEFRVTTTTVPDPAWTVKLQDGYDQPSLAYAYSIAPNSAEPNQAVIMIKATAAESSFIADRNITVSVAGGYNADFSAVSGVTTLKGTGRIMAIRQGKVIVSNVFLRSISPL